MKKLFLTSMLLFLLGTGLAQAQTDQTAICKQYGPNLVYDAARGVCVDPNRVTPTDTPASGSTTPPTSESTSNTPAASTGSAQTATPAAPTNSSSGKLTYTPLEPLPGGNAATYNSLSAYLNLMFNILLSIGAMIAVVTLVLGGITFMISEVVDKRTAARRRIQAAFIGLGLLLTCWLILNTINPELTVFSLPGISQGGITSTSGAGPGPNPSNIQGPAQQQQESCRANGPLCALNPKPGGGFSCDCGNAL